MDIDVIWEQFGQQLKFFVRARVSNSHDADDLTQEILIKSYQNINSLEDDNRLEAWLYRIARNVVNDYYRKKATNKEELLPDVDSINNAIDDDSSVNHLRNELSQCIKPFIEQLSPIYRRTLSAVDLEGVSQKELATSLGVSHSTIKSQSQRGRNQLKKLFKQCCDFEKDARGNIIEYRQKARQCNCNNK